MLFAHVQVKVTKCSLFHPFNQRLFIYLFFCLWLSIELDVVDFIAKMKEKKDLEGVAYTSKIASNSFVFIIALH